MAARQGLESSLQPWNTLDLSPGEETMGAWGAVEGAVEGSPGSAAWALLWELPSWPGLQFCAYSLSGPEVLGSASVWWAGVTSWTGVQGCGWRPREPLPRH